MNRCSFCEWIPILPWPVWPLAGHARLGQNTVVGSMTILLSWLCWGACQEEVCLDPRFLCNLTLPRFSVELPLPMDILSLVPTDLDCSSVGVHMGVAKYPSLVPIIPLPGTTLPHLRLDSVRTWYHIRHKKRCYRNHF